QVPGAAIDRDPRLHDVGRIARVDRVVRIVVVAVGAPGDARRIAARRIRALARSDGVLRGISVEDGVRPVVVVGVVRDDDLAARVGNPARDVGWGSFPVTEMAGWGGGEGTRQRRTAVRPGGA